MESCKTLRQTRQGFSLLQSYLVPNKHHLGTRGRKEAQVEEAGQGAGDMLSGVHLSVLTFFSLELIPRYLSIQPFITVPPLFNLLTVISSVQTLPFNAQGPSQGQGQIQSGRQDVYESPTAGPCFNVTDIQFNPPDRTGTSAPRKVYLSSPQCLQQATFVYKQAGSESAST
jgi:hypothetical protein